VILGQDPYHGPNQAMGLSFPVPPELKTLASLRNIYKELAASIEGFEIPKHGDLSDWSTQGVFMLNAMLTVDYKKAGSHKKIGWQKFTDAVIKKLSDEREGLIFIRANAPKYDCKSRLVFWVGIFDFRLKVLKKR
jgi:uracil-DNA glycosylase